MNIALNSISSNPEGTNKGTNQIVKCAHLGKIFNGFTSLTFPFRDYEGRVLQLWKLNDYGIVGTVFDSNDFLFIPKYRIRSAISGMC